MPDPSDPWNFFGGIFLVIWHLVIFAKQLKNNLQMFCCYFKYALYIVNVVFTIIVNEKKFKKPKVSIYPFIHSLMETLFTFDMISWLKYYVFNNDFTWTRNHYGNINGHTEPLKLSELLTAQLIFNLVAMKEGCLNTQEGCRTLMLERRRT